MRIEYDLKYRDYVLFVCTHQFLSIPVQVVYLAFAAIPFVFPLQGLGFIVTVAYAVLIYLGIWAFQFVFTAFYLYWGKNRSLLTHHTVELLEDAYFDQTRFQRSYHYWIGLTKVVRRFGFVAIYINAHMAHIVPERAFSNPEECDLFYEVLKGKIGAA